MSQPAKQVYYSIYIDAKAVRLYREDESTHTQGRILWTQKEYDTAVELALRLAKTKKLEFINHVNNFDS